MLVGLLVMISGSVSAQFNHTRDCKPAAITNFRFTSRDETMKLANEIGDLTSEQTEKLYLINLGLTRKYFFHQDATFTFDQNSTAYQHYQREKCEKVKPVLTKVQYEKFLNAEKNNEINLVSHSLRVYENRDSVLNLDSRISSTR